jgi:glycosyltransferase involved in cell wall biosynthesis
VDAPFFISGTASMNKNPRVSIGLPVYNAVNYLDECISALLAQSFTDFQIIISDNASTDGTEKLCHEWCRRDERIRYVRQPVNRGSIWNHNQVFLLSQGEYFKWMGHDDLYASDWLEKCVQLLDKQPDVVWCHTQTLHIDFQGTVVPAHEDPAIPPGKSAHSLLFTGGELPPVTRADSDPCKRFHAVILGTTWCADAYGLIRSSVLKQTHLFPTCYGPEKVLMAELALFGRYSEIPEVLSYKRFHAEASSGSSDSKKKRGFVQGTKRKYLRSDRLTLLRGYCVAVWNSPLSVRQKIQCFGMIARYVLQVRKYRRLLSGLSGPVLPKSSVQSASRVVLDSSPVVPSLRGHAGSVFAGTNNVH